MRRINIVDCGTQFGMSVARIFHDWDPVVYRPNGFNEFERQVKNADIIMLGGGQDVHPEMYKHRNTHSHCGATPSFRDLLEREIYEYAKKREIPIVGICRGAQFACAMEGGFLVQHVDHHAGRNHPVYLADGREVEMSSVHHQMMMPKNTNHDLIGWAKDVAEQFYYDTKSMPSMASKPDFWEGYRAHQPEIVHFKGSKCLAIQGHPEFMSNKSRAVALTRELTKTLLLQNSQEFTYGEV